MAGLLSQPSKKSKVDDNNLATHEYLYHQLDKRIDHLLDSAEGKARCSLHRWVGIDTQKDVMHCTRYNITCACCVTIYFIMMLILRRWRTLFKKDIKVLKSRKLLNFVLLCGIKFYVTPTQPFWPLWGVYSNKLFLALNIKFQSADNKILIYV